MSDSLRPHGLHNARLLCPCYFPGKNTGVGCHTLLQWIFLTQDSSAHLLYLLHWQAGSLPLVPLGSPHMTICCFFCCSVTKSCLTSCDPMDCSTASFPVLHCLLEFAQTHVHGVSDAIQPSHPLSLSSPPSLNLSQNQGHFQ